MTKEEVFDAWIPYGPPWSSWAKPVLFAHMELARSVNLVATLPTSIPETRTRTALVLDLPGAEGISVGIALAKIGYRPVPLYNALPLPHPVDPQSHAHGVPPARVDVVPIISALKNGAEILSLLKLAPDAPPAFLLDAERRGSWLSDITGQFDNRSVSFPTDFPSAEILSSHGIRSVVLVQRNREEPQPDLEQTFRRWKESGIPLERLVLEPGAKIEPLVLKPKSWYRSILSTIVWLTYPQPNNGSFGDWTSAGG